MTELIQKRKQFQLVENLEKFTTLTEFMEFMNKEIELAYKAGTLHFNAFTHDLKVVGEEGKLVNSHWTKEHVSINYGTVQHLADLYLQAKGYKC